MVGYACYLQGSKRLNGVLVTMIKSILIHNIILFYKIFKLLFYKLIFTNILTIKYNLRVYF